MKLEARGQTLTFPRRPLVMGIVNLSGDSFSGDGLTDPAQALEHARALVAEGAEIIDVGAESARTNRAVLPAEEEIARLQAFLHLWQKSGPGETLLSLNTWRPEVVRAVLPLGGHLLNDLGGMPDGENAALCARHGAALLIMHTAGAPKVPHTHVEYEDIMETLEAFFAAKLRLAEEAGLAREAVVLDPGIDFAKQRPDNLRIFRELRRLHSFGRPVLLPVSRKTVIGEVLNLPHAADRDAGTVACLVVGVRQGAQIFRVHNVRAAVQAIHMLEAVGASAAPPLAGSKR